MPDATPVAKRLIEIANSQNRAAASAREVQDRLTEAARTGDVETMVGLYHPDAMITSPDGVFRGRDEIEQFVRAQFEPFSDLRIFVERKVDAGDIAIDEGRFEGTHTGPYTLANGETIAPTGRRVAQRSVDVATVRDGKIASHTFYYDNLDLYRQLGATG